MDYVWYLSYGSNMDQQRFLCYIKGLKYHKSTNKEQGCKDDSEPLSVVSTKIDHELYFSKKSSKWQGGGVGFISNEKGASETFAVMYLITREQFEDVVKQENGLKVENDLRIDYQQLNEKDQIILFENRWYGLLLRVGEHESHPIYTFTSPNQDLGFKKPSHEYLQTILSGVKQNFEVDNDEIFDYFSNVNGVKENYNRNELLEIINHI